MPSTKSERRGHVRRPSKPGYQVLVAYSQGHAKVQAETRDLGLGGAFIATAAPLPVGAKIELELHLPSVPEPLSIRAEVRWHERKGAPGMGVKFRGLQVEEVVALDEYVSSLSDD